MEQYKTHDIRYLDTLDIPTQIIIRGRIDTIRQQKNVCFILLRYQDVYLQVIGIKKQLKEQFKKVCSVSNESVVRFYGTLQGSPADIANATYKNIELVLENFNIISEATKLPLLVKDADDYSGSFRSNVGQNIRLDNRWLDLRSPVNLSIFKVKSQIMQQFRQYLTKQNFIEINTPKIIGVASESGADVFELKYFEKKAYLAQSPQLYKQMAINSDFDRVFEVGPVFRAENSFSNRHLCEFTGLDLEMTITDGGNHFQIMNFAWNMLTSMFDNILSICSKELEIINEKLPFDKPVYPKYPLIINHTAAADMLKEMGVEQGYNDDLSTANEKILGTIIKQNYNSDLFVLNKYPRAARPFYTMLDEDKNFTKSFDIIFRGKEISSGAQRVHDYNELLERLNEANIDPNSMKSYVESFSHGSMPHGGCGIGLERLTAYFLDMNSVKMTSFCPRDPKRITP